jgi:biopolymer transport protein ExbD
VNVALPRSRNPEAVPPTALNLTIRRDGSLELAGREVRAADLPSILATAFQGKEERTLIIQADRGVAFGRVIEVMEAARSGGAQDISFLVEPAGQGEAGAPAKP